jgi:hypothetical protein
MTPQSTPVRKKTWSKRWTFFALCILLIVGVFYSGVLAKRVVERAFIVAASSVVQRKPIKIGANAYGQIKSIYVQEGQQVAQGDTIFSYLATDKDNVVKEVKVTTLAAGTVSLVNSGVGGYITPDSAVVELQSSVTLVKSKLKLDPSEISKLKIGDRTLIELPSGTKTLGSIYAIRPAFDKKEGTVEIESTITRLDEEVYSGSPVGLKVYVGDDLASKAAHLVQKINIPKVEQWFLADWNLVQ